MRIRRIIKAVLALFVLLAWPVAGETDSDQVDTDTLYAGQWAASGAQELWNQLTPETREQLNRWGITDFSSLHICYNEHTYMHRPHTCRFR